MKFDESVRSWSGIVILVGAVAGFSPRLCADQVAPLIIVETNDFGNTFGSLTPISPVLEVGTNILQGSVSWNTFVDDEDFVRISLPQDSRLSGLNLIVTNYSGPNPGAFGYFAVLPVEEGNSGEVAFIGNIDQPVGFLIGTPTNIVLHWQAPFADLGDEAGFEYELEMIVAPVEVVPGTAIYTAVEITFPSEYGPSYQLQCTSSLDSNSWINVGAPMLGVGGTMSAFDTTRHDGQRFYRVVKQ